MGMYIWVQKEGDEMLVGLHTKEKDVCMLIDKTFVW